VGKAPKKKRKEKKRKEKKRKERSVFHSFAMHPQCLTNKTTMTSSQSSAAPSPHISLLAGVIAGGVEGFVTYPAEFVKTRAQFGASDASGVVSVTRYLAMPAGRPISVLCPSETVR
jgi:hypothetical protein